LFRIKNSFEIKNIGLFENYQELLTLVEWPEKIEHIIEDKIDLFLEYRDNTEKRLLKIKGLDKEKINEIK
jgi:tRNA threonylcarbamoyladenosine biosynthesis protein TsaE